MKWLLMLKEIQFWLLTSHITAIYWKCGHTLYLVVIIFGGHYISWLLYFVIYTEITFLKVDRLKFNGK